MSTSIHDDHDDDDDAAGYAEFRFRYRCPWCATVNVPLRLHERCDPVRFWCECTCMAYQKAVLE